MINLKTGSLTQDELAAMLDALPGDLTFAGADDAIRYFNEPAKRLFPRDQAILGTSVQSCHPEKSVPLVNELLADLKTGRKDVVEAWANLGDRLIHIRYFAVRSQAGGYLGCLEFAQDVPHALAHEAERG